MSPVTITELKSLLTIKSFEMRQRAKFRQNRSIRGRNIVIFRFFENGGRRHLGFLKFQILTVGRSKGSIYVTVPNFAEIGLTAAEIS